MFGEECRRFRPVCFEPVHVSRSSIIDPRRCGTRTGSSVRVDGRPVSSDRALSGVPIIGDRRRMTRQHSPLSRLSGRKTRKRSRQAGKRSRAVSEAARRSGNAPGRPGSGSRRPGEASRSSGNVDASGVRHNFSPLPSPGSPQTGASALVDAELMSEARRLADESQGKNSHPSAFPKRPDLRSNLI